MNETETGIYGRTNTGKIFMFAWLANEKGATYENKVILVESEKLTGKFYYFNENEKLVKHSKDITDLIETTDILKVKLSEEWVEKEDSIAFIVVEQIETIKEIKEALENGMYTIEKILTHEKFENNSYKVGV